MTPQTTIVLLGTGAAGVAKFGLGKDWKTALLYGLAAIAAFAILTAHRDAE